MKNTFFARNALRILMIVFFLTPFALRGARLAVQGIKNDVKDWLPSDFQETAELDWFREHFLGEQFVAVSWEGCEGTADDEIFKTFVDKFFPEIPPSLQNKRDYFAEWISDEANDTELSSSELPPELYPRWQTNVVRSDFISPITGLYARQLHPSDLPPEEEFIGNQYGLFHPEDDHHDWAEQDEKWLMGFEDKWYFITPDGKLYEWSGGNSILQPILSLLDKIQNKHDIPGTLVKDLGPVDGPWYYANPERLNARLFKSVVTGPGILSNLTAAGGSLEGDIETAKKRLSGYLFGPNGKQTCVVVTLTEAAKADLRRTLGRGMLGKPRGVLVTLAEESGIRGPAKPSLIPPFIDRFLPDKPVPDPPVIKMGGPSVDNVAIDEEGQITLVRLVGLSVLVGLGLSWLSFRSVKVTIMVFFVGGLSAVTSVSLIYWSHSSIDAVMMSMPSLVYVLGLSGAVHIVNYYRETVEEQGMKGATERAIKLGWKPCTLAAFTTALGLISLYSSEIFPIKRFGLFSALGVMATLVLLFTYLPAAMQLWPPTRFKRGDATSKTKIEQYIELFWLHVGEFITSNYRIVAVCCLLIMGLVGYGINLIRTDVQLLKMFDGDSKIINDYRWLEDNLGHLVPMELVVRVRPDAMLASTGESTETTTGPESSTTDPTTVHAPVGTDPFGLNFLERMEIGSYVQDALDKKFGPDGRDIIGQAMLANTFAPVLPDAGGGTRAMTYRSGWSKSLEKSRTELESSDYLRTDKSEASQGSELWRISLRLGALNDIDYGTFVNDLKETVEPIMSAYQVRRDLLHKLAERHGGSFRGQRIWLVGYPAPPEEDGDEPTDASGGSAELQNEQTELFAHTLFELLRNAGLNVARMGQQARPIQEWQEKLGVADGVVLISDVQQTAAEDLIKLNPLVLDSRAHHFTPGNQTANQRGASVSTVYTGLVPIVYKAQRTLLQSLIESTGWAFVMIAVVMMFLLRSIRAGLISMIPNVFPVICIFGTMGWSGILVDIGSMMTAGVAMGVAVDDTIHFLTWFRRGLDKGLDRIESIKLAYRRVAMSMTQTTAIGGLGLSIFAFSTFTPTQRFGMLMLSLLAAALVGDLIFLPALLASPLGRVFKGSDKKNKLDSTGQRIEGRHTADESVPRPHSLPTGSVRRN